MFESHTRDGFFVTPASTISGLPCQTIRRELEENGFRKSSFAGSSFCSGENRLNKKKACILFHDAPGLHVKRAAIIVVLNVNHGESDLPPSNGPPDKKDRVKYLWEELFSDPSQWCDNRWIKTSNKQPDFKHKVTLEALWIDGWLNPPWVKEKLAKMAFDPINSSGGTTSRVPSSFGDFGKVQKLTSEGRLKEALHLLELIVQQTSEAPQGTIVCLLRACTRRKALAEGKQVHALIGKMRGDASILLSNLLIGMYSACGSILDALKVFTSMPQHNVFSWTAMISAYEKGRHYKEAVTLSQQMHQSGVEPDEVACVVALKACANVPNLEHGKHLHLLILKKGFGSNVIVQNALLTMYAKCGCLEDAREEFSKMTERNLVSWNVLIVSYIQKGLRKEALDLYEQMKQEGMDPDNVTLVLLLKVCAGISALQQGKQLHSLILEKGLDSQLIVQNSLIDMYSKCGCLQDAQKLFDNMAERTVVSWNAMISGYTQEGLGKEVLDLYGQMQLEGMEPDNVTLVLLLKACTSISALKIGKTIHALILEKGLESQLNIQNTLVDMYSKCGCLMDARKLFDNMDHRNVVSCNVMIAGYAQEGLGKEAFALYEQMRCEGMEPDEITFVLLLKACTSISDLQQGKQLHSLIIEKGLETQLILKTALVDMYSKCGCLKDARRLFDNMNVRNVISWNAMVAGYAQEGLGKEALDLYKQMMREGMEPDNITLVLLLKACASISNLLQGKQLHSLILEKGLEAELIIQTALVDMYSKCGCLKDARKLFDNMNQRNVVSWNAMLAGYAQEGLGMEALDLYEQMKREGAEPDNITFVLLLKVCASISALQQGKQLHSLIFQKGLESQLMVQTALVDMYSKCGCLKEAREVFDNMVERDVVSWTVMIAGYAQEGLGKEALDLFQKMQDEGLQANAITYTSVLSACSHSGLLDKGRHVFESMSKLYGVTPTLDHYACMVDLLGRAGCLSDAEDLILKRPALHVKLCG